jgi:hypothetical protein
VNQPLHLTELHAAVAEHLVGTGVDATTRSNTLGCGSLSKLDEDLAAFHVSRQPAAVSGR